MPTTIYKPFVLELKDSRNSPDCLVRDGSINMDNVDRLFQSSSTGLLHALTKAREALLTAQSAIMKLEETSQKLSHINKETFRQRLTDEEGIPWAKAFSFDTLARIVE